MKNLFGRWEWAGTTYSAIGTTLRFRCPDCKSKHSEFLMDKGMVQKGFLKYRRYCNWCGAKLNDVEGGNEG